MPSEQIWCCMRMLGVVYVRVVQDIYEDSKAVVRCVVAVIDGFKMRVELCQGLALRPFLSVVLMIRLTD